MTIIRSHPIYVVTRGYGVLAEFSAVPAVGDERARMAAEARAEKINAESFGGGAYVERITPDGHRERV